MYSPPDGDFKIICDNTQALIFSLPDYFTRSMLMTVTGATQREWSTGGVMTLTGLHETVFISQL